MNFEPDPRWNRRSAAVANNGQPTQFEAENRFHNPANVVSQGAAPLPIQGTAQMGAGGAVGNSQVQNPNGVANRQSAKDKESSALSIVFDASWVKLSSPIGEGAFSRVFEGVYTHPETGEQNIVAVKILKKSMLKRRSDCLRFIKEAKIMTKISQRNIVACYGIGKYDDEDEQNPGSLFIVQELVQGSNLLHKVYKQMLNRQKCVYASHEALAWLIDVALGMQYLHSVSEGKPMIIHRDLKLENIMLSHDVGGGTVAKLVDFGLHKVIDERIKRVVKRVVSEACIGSNDFSNRHFASAMGAVDEFDEEADVDGGAQRGPVGNSLSSRFKAAQSGGIGAGGALGGRGGSGGIGGGSGGIGGGGGGIGGRRGFQPLRAIPGVEEGHEGLEGEETAAVATTPVASASPNGSAPIPSISSPLPGQGHSIPPPTDASSGYTNGNSATLKLPPISGATVAEPSHTGSPGPPSPVLSKIGTDASSSSSIGFFKPKPPSGTSPADSASTELPRVRPAPKKQSSMQKLMTKVKELKLKVAVKFDSSPSSAANKKGVESGEASAAVIPGASAAAAAAATPAVVDSSAATPHSSATPTTIAGVLGNNANAAANFNNVNNNTSNTTTTNNNNNNNGVAAAANSPSGMASPVTMGSGNSTPTAAAQSSVAASSVAVSNAERMAKNEALLNRLVAEQSQAAALRHHDDNDILSNLNQERRRAPPRRATTWVNDVKYNLTEAVGSWAYMAPEVVLGMPYNEKVDVFSFGVIMFEVLNRKLMLVDEIKNDPRKDAQAYAERVAKGHRPDVPRWWPEPLRGLITACWAQDPLVRPNFVAVLDCLQEIQAADIIGKLDVMYWSRDNVFI
eukprot:CAMPEP_0175080042 /NCGR_PEP_ID=MMETSP0052_2-20121109/25243_1 /TAXON_ID=51329 ORGANISM="Polytomella parva, Strain SAG 63-3" /NCGR_SAMPLE_ID=MMETSP0052_2 /ASSEMBLY_ACC=CAM_ASM_000194 /LENGTH=850 /DNA_ID=CAMNT_0016350609 /DNA_START=39 /DNA_END=2591 /DNA_ORIENTATION=-